MKTGLLIFTTLIYFNSFTQSKSKLQLYRPNKTEPENEFKLIFNKVKKNKIKRATFYLNPPNGDGGSFESYVYEFSQNGFISKIEHQWGYKIKGSDSLYKIEIFTYNDKGQILTWKDIEGGQLKNYYQYTYNPKDKLKQLYVESNPFIQSRRKEKTSFYTTYHYSLDGDTVKSIILQDSARIYKFYGTLHNSCDRKNHDMTDKFEIVYTYSFNIDKSLTIVKRESTFRGDTLLCSLNKNYTIEPNIKIPIDDYCGLEYYNVWRLEPFVYQDTGTDPKSISYVLKSYKKNKSKCLVEFY